MAERTPTNVGEPADERSVDGCAFPPVKNKLDAGDEEPPNNSRESIGDFNQRFDKLFPDLDSVSRPDFHSFYEQNDAHSSTDPDWNDKDSTKDSTCQISRTDVCYKIIPLIGASCYEYFSITIMNPSWFLRAFDGIDCRVKNTLWLQSQLGIGFYIFSRRHIQALPLSRRIVYSAFGSFLFNYGSCLFWAVGKTFIPNTPFLCVGFGLLSGGILLSLGHDYLLSVDKMCSDQID